MDVTQWNMTQKDGMTYSPLQHIEDSYFLCLYSCDMCNKSKI